MLIHHMTDAEIAEIEAAEHGPILGSAVDTTGRFGTEAERHGYYDRVRTWSRSCI